MPCPKTCSLTCYLLAVTALCSAQTTASISGSVRDPQGAAIPDASVTLVSRDNTISRKATTDSSGRYRLDNLAAGAYLLAASARGFENAPARRVEVARPEALLIDLQLQIAPLSTSVTVTASGTPQTTDELSKSLSVVDAQTIDALDQSSIAGALRYLPGLRVQQLGGPGAMMSVKTRGLRNQDTAVLIDGFRVRDASATQGDGSGVLEDLIVTDIDRVEVLRGAGSSIYGTDATGGVINIISAQGGGGTHASLLAEGGSLDAFRGRANLSGTLDRERADYSLGVAHWNTLAGVTGDDPARTSSLQTRFGFTLAPSTRVFSRFYLADSFSKLSASPEVAGSVPATGIVDAVPLSTTELRRFESGAPLSALNTADVTFLPSYTNPDNTRAARVYSGALNFSTRPTESLSLTATYQGLATQKRFGDGPAGAGYQPSGNTLAYYDGQVHTASGRLDWRLGRHQSVDAGYEFENESYSNRSLAPDPADNSTVDVVERSNAVFVQDQLHLLGDRLEVAGSYRAQFFSLRRPSFTPAASAPYAGLRLEAPPTAQTADGSAAWFFRTTGTKIRTHAGKGYRAPSLYERFGSYFSSFGYSAYGDPRLKPERSVSIDAGVDQSLWSNRARLSATYFYTRLEEVIFFDAVGIMPATDPYGRYGGYRNTNGGLARGLELTATAAPTRSLSLSASYTYTNAREATPLEDNLLRTYLIPDHQFSLLVTDRVTPKLTILFGLVMSSNYLAPLFDPVTYASRAYRFDGMKQAQLGASYRLPLGERRAVRFFVNGENIFDQTYFESGYRTPGATARGGMMFEF